MNEIKPTPFAEIKPIPFAEIFFPKAFRADRRRYFLWRTGFDWVKKISNTHYVVGNYGFNVHHRAFATITK